MVAEAVVDVAGQPVAFGRRGQLRYSRGVLLQFSPGALLAYGDGGHRDRQHQADAEHQQVGHVLHVAIPGGGCQQEAGEQSGQAQCPQNERRRAAECEVGGERQEHEEDLGQFRGIRGDHGTCQPAPREQQRHARQVPPTPRQVQCAQGGEPGDEAGRAPGRQPGAGAQVRRQVVDAADEDRAVQQR
jgi:hypothetical protein